MKKLLFINFIVFFTIFLLFNTKIFAVQDEDNEIFEPSEIQNILETVSGVSDYPDTSSKHIIAFDRDSKRILFEKDGFSQTPMASTTKILTAIIAIENCDLNEEVSISKKAANTSGSTLGITSNTTIYMKDLLYGLMLRSGNDCAVAIAEHIGGSIEGFSNIMNEKATSLGLKDSHFTSPHGLDDDNHYTTAYELALITDYALQNETFRKIVSTKETTVQLGNNSKTISNTNELLGNYDGIYGVKTGFTFNGGRCLVTACKRNDLDVIVVVLGADTKKIRTIDSIKVLNYVFKNYKKVDISNIINEEFYKFENYFSKNTSVEKSTHVPSLELAEIKERIYPFKKDELNCIHSEIYSLTKLYAPIKSGTKIGEISIKVNNEILFSTNILIKEDISKKTWATYYKELIKNFFYI